MGANFTALAMEPQGKIAGTASAAYGFASTTVSSFIGYLVAGLSLGAMTIGGLIAGMAVALLSGFVTRVTALREDASLAAFYLISLALGVLIVTTRGSNVDLMHVLF